MRVATFHQSSLVLQNALKTQARLASVQNQQSSGLKSHDFAGLGGNALTVANLEVSIARSEARVNAAKDASTRTEMVHAALGNINNILTKMRASVSGAKTDDQIAALQKEAAGYLKDVASQLNTRFAGRYLLGGSKTQAPPVDLDGFKVDALSTADLSYYKGDSYVQSVRVSPERSIDYGVTGDRSGFEKTMRVLSFVANASPLEAGKLAEISDLLVSAQDDVIADQSINGNASERLKTFIDSEKTYLAEAGKLSSELVSTDIAAAAVTAASYKVQLQASFSAIKTLTSLNLADYLR